MERGIGWGEGEGEGEDALWLQVGIAMRVSWSC